MPTNPFTGVWEEVKRCNRHLDPKGIFIVEVPEDLRIRIEDLADTYVEVREALMPFSGNTVRFRASKAVEASKKPYLKELKRRKGD